MIELFGQRRPRDGASVGPETPEEAAKRVDALFAAADAKAHADLALMRDANRRARFERRRPPQYADARYEMLSRQQNPKGKVASWWAAAEGRPDLRGLWLFGPSRTGKTTSAYAVANDVHDRGKWVEVWTAAGLWKAIRAGEDGSESNAYEYARDCDLLVLDDLGREKPTDAWIETLQELMGARLGTRGKMIVTANAVGDAEQAWNDLVDKYGDPLVERIFDGAGPVLVNGPKRRNIVTEW